MSKAILFGRVSTMHQDLVQQINELKLEASRMGYDDEDLIIIEYKESGISLDTEERLGIQELKKAIETHNNIDCVFIYEISRLSRRPKVLYEVRDWLIEKQINLICIKPYMRLLEDGKLSQTANILFSLFSSISESEMMIKKERMNRGRYHKRSQNKYIGGGVLFGYGFDEKENLIVDEKKSEIVKYIFNEYEHGRSCSDLATELVDRGLIYADNYKSGLTYISDTLRHIEYTGTNQPNRYQYPQIISKEQWEKCREIRENKKKQYSNTKFVYWCKGLLRSKESKMLISGHYNNGKYHYEDKNSGECISININFIDSLTWQIVKDRRKSSNPKDIENERLAINKLIKETDDKLKTIDKRIEKIRESIDKANERIILGKLNEAKGDELIQNMQIEISNYEEEKDRLNSKHTEYMNRIIYITSFFYQPDLYDNITDEKEIHNIIKSEIKNIWLTKDDKKYYNHIEYEFIDGSRLYVYGYKSQKKAVAWIDDNEYKFKMLERTSRRKQ